MAPRKSKPKAQTRVTKVYPAKYILMEGKTHYVIEWEGLNPKTKRPWLPTAEPKECANALLIAEWEAQGEEVRAAREAMVRPDIKRKFINAEKEALAEAADSPEDPDTNDDLGEEEPDETQADSDVEEEPEDVEESDYSPEPQPVSKLRGAYIQCHTRPPKKTKRSPAQRLSAPKVQTKRRSSGRQLRNTPRPAVKRPRIESPSPSTKSDDTDTEVQDSVRSPSSSDGVSVKAASDGDSEIQDQEVEMAEPQSKLGDEDDSTSEVQSESEDDEEDVGEIEQNSSDQNDSASDVEIKVEDDEDEEGVEQDASGQDDSGSDVQIKVEDGEDDQGGVQLQDSPDSSLSTSDYLVPHGILDWREDDDMVLVEWETPEGGETPTLTWESKFRVGKELFFKFVEKAKPIVFSFVDTVWVEPELTPAQMLFRYVDKEVYTGKISDPIARKTFEEDENSPPSLKIESRVSDKCLLLDYEVAAEHSGWVREHPEAGILTVLVLPINLRDAQIDAVKDSWYNADYTVPNNENPVRFHFRMLEAAHSLKDEGLASIALTKLRTSLTGTPDPIDWYWLVSLLYEQTARREELIWSPIFQAVFPMVFASALNNSEAWKPLREWDNILEGTNGRFETDIDLIGDKYEDAFNDGKWD